MADSLRECVEHGQEYGVLVGDQNRGDMLRTGDQVLKVVQMVDSDWFGAIVDTGYFQTPDPYRDIAQVETVDALRRVMPTAGVAPPQGTPIGDREGSSPEAALRPSP